MGADIILNASASPYFAGKGMKSTIPMFVNASRYYEVPMLYLDVAGMQSGGILGGHSFICNSEGKKVRQFAFFQEDADYNIDFNILDELPVVDEDNVAE